jgi:type IV secretory pathway TraG/TraD family ATPase VirD4
VSRLGRDVHKTFSGVVGAVDKFLSPIANAYAPDIIFEDILETNGLVYVQLPGNLFKLQAPALGRVFLQDIQQEGSLRQVERSTRDQSPFGVYVDEFARFADLSIVDSLSQLRDAGLQYLLAHQSIADLRLVSPEFATSVWDNSRVKIILNQDNPELCELIAKSIGTRQGVQLTVRRDTGARNQKHDNDDVDGHDSRRRNQWLPMMQRVLPIPNPAQLDAIFSE